MQKVYKEIVGFMVKSGKRIKKKAGNIDDIGITKKDLTIEDLKIERGLKKIIKKHNPSHEFYSEEENFNFVESDDVWVGDPISGTAIFIRGLAHYGMAMAHVLKGEVVFAVVYDPSVDQLYTAFKGRGAFFNGKKFKYKDMNSPSKRRVMFLLSNNWKNKKQCVEMLKALTKFKLYRPWISQAVSWCHLAKGIYNGMVCFGKDSFPNFAGSLILKEAGCKFGDLNGNTEVNPEETVFVGGDKQTYKLLLPMIKKVLKK